MKKSKILGSVVLASVIATGASADVKLFGHLGALYTHGLGDAKSDKGNSIGAAGLTGHLGVDIGFGGAGFGVGAWGGSQLWGAQVAGKGYGERFMYGSDYIDLSDLYFRYNSMFDFYVGRFDGNFLKADWIDNYIQGVGFSYKLGADSNIWATWANDYTTFGAMPGRIASELQNYRRFPSSFNNFGVGDRDMFGLGLNYHTGLFDVDPFLHYWLGAPGWYNDNVLQAGVKGALKLGGGGFKSISTARFMWQNATNSNTYLIWLDQEFRLAELFKVGAGWYMTGNEGGIVRMTDHARFYGRYTIPQGGGYFGNNQNTWYVFGGVVHNRFKLDVLYAGGDYKEFSAVGSVRVFDASLAIMRDGLGIDVGAGYVNNGFSDSFRQDSLIAFAKLVF